MKTRCHILLTGPSGIVGLEIIRQLASNKNVALTVFDRKTPSAVKLLSPYKKRISIIYGDISNADDLKRIPSNLHAVIHLAAIMSPFADERPDLAYQVNVGGTYKLIKQLEKNSPNTFFLYSSSVQVYGDRIHLPNIRVTDPLIPSEGDEYAYTKIEAEALIQQCELDWSIFRLTTIMKNHKISKLMFHMPLDTIMEICSPEDAALAFINAIEKRVELSGNIFNLGGGERCRITYRDFLEKTFRLFGLGELDFPRNTFAERNYHCGIYADGDKLEEILHFRKDNLDSYFDKVKRSVPAIKVFLTSLFQKEIKRSLLKQSEPYRAFNEKNRMMLKHFFGEPDLQGV